MASDATLRAASSPAIPYFGTTGRAATLSSDLNEKVTLTEGTAITAGTYTLTFGGQTTGAIQWDATAATIQTALIALSSIDAAGVTVTGGPVGTAAVVIEFSGGTHKNTNVGAVTSTQTSLTGDFTIAVTQAATIKSALIDLASEKAEGRATYGTDASSPLLGRQVGNAVKVSATRHMISSKPTGDA